MKIRKTYIFIAVCTAVILFISSLTISAGRQVVIKADESVSGLPLAGRWQWAAGESRAVSGGFWIGYSIGRLMSPYSSMVSTGPDMANLPTIEELLSGKEMPACGPSELEAAINALRRMKKEKDGKEDDGIKVEKEIALLFRFAGNLPDMKNVTEIEISSLNRSVRFKGKPLIWLGNVPQQESAAFLSGKYDGGLPGKVKESFMAVFGIHTDSPAAAAFLIDAVKGGEPEDIREKAVFWLGQHNNRAALYCLRETLKTEASSKIREKIVFSISQMKLEGAQEALFAAARDNADPGVQEQAVFWLSQRQPDEETVRFLEGIAEGPARHSVREKAVFALSQVRERSALDALVRLARTCKDRGIKKKAIFWLGQHAASDESLAALTGIAEDDPELEIREQAVFALSQLKGNSGIPALIKIAESGRSAAVRKKAVFWLGQSDDPKAHEAIINLVTRKDGK